MNGHQGFMLKQGAIFVALLVGAVGGVQAGNYSNAYFFGDSLSDSGVYGPLVGPNDRFTTNPGTVWAQNLGAAYGSRVLPAYAASMAGFAPNAIGSNFSIGGARVNAVPGVLSGALAPLAAAIPPVSAQVSSFLARGPVDSSALYGVWAGANDVFTQTDAVAAGGSPGAAQAAMVRAASDLTTQIARLQAAGVSNLVVIGLPDIGKTPFGASAGISGAALLSGLSTVFNRTLMTGLAGKNLLYFDGAKLFSVILADPLAYGFTNTRIPACGAASSLGCAPGAAAVGAMFADGVHPSASLHRIISDWVYSSLEGASRVGLLAQVPLGRSGAQWRAIDGRLREFQNFGYQGQGFFVSGDYAASTVDAHAGLPSADGSSGSFVLGYEKALSAELFAGATLGYGNAPFDLGNDQGTVKYNEWALSAFVSHKSGNFYANALTTYSWLDYESKRNVALGPFSATERGDTKGGQFGAKAQIGYNFVVGNLLHGPLAGLAWERVNVDGFSEQSDSVTAMSFGEQTRESLRSRLGWQVAAETMWSGAKVRPYALLTYDYEHRKDERSYSAGFVGGNSAMLMKTANQTGGYGTLLAGATAEVSKTLRLGVGASTTIGQPDARNFALNVTLSAPF